MVSFYKLKCSNFISSDNLFVGSVDEINPDSKFMALGVRRRHVVSNLNYSCFMSRRAALFLFGAFTRKARPLLSLGKQFADNARIMSLCRSLLISYVRDWVPGLLTNYSSLASTLLKNKDALQRVGYFFNFPDILLLFGESYDIARISREARLLGVPTIANIGSTLNIKHFTYAFFGNWSSYRASRFFTNLFFSVFSEARRYRAVRYFSIFKRLIRSLYLRRTFKIKLRSLKFVKLRLVFKGKRHSGKKLERRPKKWYVEKAPCFFRAFVVGVKKYPVAVARFRWYRRIMHNNAPMRRASSVSRFPRLKYLKAQDTLLRLKTRLRIRFTRPSHRYAIPKFIGTAPRRMEFRNIFPFLGYFGYGYLAKRVSSFFFFKKIFQFILEKRSRILFLKSLTSKISVLCRSSLRVRALKKTLIRGFRYRRAVRVHMERLYRDKRFLRKKIALMKDSLPNWRYKKDYIDMMRDYYRVPEADYWKYFFTVPQRSEEEIGRVRDKLRSVKSRSYPPYAAVEAFPGLSRRTMKRLTLPQREAFFTYAYLLKRFPRFVSRVEGSSLVMSRLSRSYPNRYKRPKRGEKGDIKKSFKLPKSDLAYSSTFSRPAVPVECFSFKYQRYIENRKNRRRNKFNKGGWKENRSFNQGATGKLFNKGHHKPYSKRSFKPNRG